MVRLRCRAGRDYNDGDHIWDVLNHFHWDNGPITCVIHGAARGADTQAMMQIPHAPFVPEWDRLGKAAGVIRNQRMLDEGKPNIVIAFPGGIGTDDMKKRAKKAGIKIIQKKFRTKNIE